MGRVSNGSRKALIARRLKQFCYRIVAWAARPRAPLTRWLELFCYHIVAWAVCLVATFYFGDSVRRFGSLLGNAFPWPIVLMIFLIGSCVFWAVVVRVGAFSLSHVKNWRSFLRHPPA